MLKANSYKQTQFAQIFSSSQTDNFSSHTKHQSSIIQNGYSPPKKFIQPQLLSEQLFFRASLQYARKKKIANYFLFFDDLIGQGSFAKVYKGMNISTREIVAIKVMEMEHIMKKKLYSLLEAEIQIFKSLKHPNVLRCYDILITDNHCYIVTELCDDGQLKHFIQKQKKISQKDQFDTFTFQPLIYDIYQGLLYLERKNIIHRDIKMANILVKNGKAKIADFGFATFCKDTINDLMVGSPIYMAPQSFLRNIYSSKSDVWAFGVLIYELFHGFSPFQHCKNDQQLEKHIRIPFKRQQIKNLLNEDIINIIIQCLIYDHQLRPSFKDLWTHSYMKNLRFKIYVQSKQLVFYKEASSFSSLKETSKIHSELNISINESLAFDCKQQNFNHDLESNTQENEEGYSFEDFLKLQMSQTESFVSKDILESNSCSPIKTKNHLNFESNIFSTQTKSQNKKFENEMQEFYRQAQKMMQNDNSMETQDKFMTIQRNFQSKQITKEDQVELQEYQQGEKSIKNIEQENILHSQSKLRQNIQNPDEQNTKIKTYINEKESREEQQIKIQQIQSLQPKKGRKINLDKEYCIESSLCDQKKILISSVQGKDLKEIKPTIQDKYQAQNQKAIFSENLALKSNQKLQNQNSSKIDSQKIQTNQIKQFESSPQQQQSPIQRQKIASELSINLNLEQKKQELLKDNKKTHNQNLSKFENILKKHSKTNLNASQKSKKLITIGKQTQQIDEIFLLLQFSRFILKFIRFADKLTEAFRNEQIISNTLTESQNSTILQVIESYNMIFSSYTLNKELFLQEELYTICQEVLIKRVSEITLELNPNKNQQLFQIIKSHRIYLRNAREEKQSLKELKVERKGLAKHINSQILQKIYKAIKIIEEPVTNLNNFQVEDIEEGLFVIGTRLNWIGLWLCKIYDIFLKIQMIFKANKNFIRESLKPQNCSQKLIKEMEIFLEDYNKAQCILHQQKSFEKTNNAQNQNKAQSYLLKEEIGIFFQFLYEIELKIMNFEVS